MTCLDSSCQLHFSFKYKHELAKRQTICLEIPTNYELVKNAFTGGVGFSVKKTLSVENKMIWEVFLPCVEILYLAKTLFQHINTFK